MGRVCGFFTSRCEATHSPACTTPATSSSEPSGVNPPALYPCASDACCCFLIAAICSAPAATAMLAAIGARIHPVTGIAAADEYALSAA